MNKEYRLFNFDNPDLNQWEKVDDETSLEIPLKKSTDSDETSIDVLAGIEDYTILPIHVEIDKDEIDEFINYCQ